MWNEICLNPYDYPEEYQRYKECMDTLCRIASYMNSKTERENE